VRPCPGNSWTYRRPSLAISSGICAPISQNTIKADAIAAQQLHALREHYSGKPRISDAGDVPADERRSMTVWIYIN
jgi:hypothetical protein